MQIITRIVPRIQLARHTGVPYNGIEIHHRIKPSRIADPIVHPLPCPFALWVTVRLDTRLVCGCGKGGYCGGEDGDTERMDAQDNLVVGLDESVADSRLSGRGGSSATDIVDALEEHGVADAGLAEDVAVDSGQRGGAEAVGEDAVTASGLIQDAEGAEGRLCSVLEVVEQ